MANSVVYTPIFEKYYKKYIRKNLSLKSQISKLESELIANPETGVSLGNNLYKLRLANRAKNKGKRAGYRIITYLIIRSERNVIINLLIIYDKSDIEDISKEELLSLIKSL